MPGINSFEAKCEIWGVLEKELGYHGEGSQGLEAAANCCSVAKSCRTLCQLMDCSTSGFPVLHYHLQFAQTHVH